MKVLSGFCLVALGACPPAVDVSAGLIRVELRDEFCGAAQTSCSHLETQAVDFDGGSFERHTCVEGVDGGSAAWGPSRGDTVESKTLSAAQLDQVRSAVAGLQTQPATIEFLDGAMSEVLITTPARVQSFSPGAACGPQHYEKVVGGFQPLDSLLRSF
jgi:hypothetical protein